MRRYGVFTEHKWSLTEPTARLTNEAGLDVWECVVAVVRRGMKKGRTLPKASRDCIRESTFTFLNHFVGLKCLEVRGASSEVITTREIYGGRSRAHRASETSTAARPAPPTTRCRPAWRPSAVASTTS